jgi:hypothetical protein
VFAPGGTLMYDTTWHSYYVGEPTVVRIGTKPRPKPKQTPPPEDKTKTPPPTGEDLPAATQPAVTATAATPTGR